MAAYDLITVTLYNKQAHHHVIVSTVAWDDGIYFNSDEAAASLHGSELLYHRNIRGIAITSVIDFLFSLFFLETDSCSVYGNTTKSGTHEIPINFSEESFTGNSGTCLLFGIGPPPTRLHKTLFVRREKGSTRASARPCASVENPPISGEGLLEASDSVTRWALSPLFSALCSFVVACTAILDCKADGERKERGKGLENLVASHDRGVPGFSVDFRGVSGFENASSWL